MSDTMLHSILQMPPEIWSNDAIDIAQRHGRYLEASERIAKLKRERDEARRERDSALKERDAVWNSWSKALDEAREELTRVRKELVAANRGAERNAKVNQGLCARLAEAERERDEERRERDDALKEWDLAREGWNNALDERDEARRERDEAMDALKWIAKRYCHEKSTLQLAQEAYEMSSKARWTIQKIELKEEA